MKAFLEGPSYVGKTSLLNQVRETDDSVRIIDEHDIYAHGIGNFPPFPNTSANQAAENVDFFFDLEQLRHRDAQEMQLTGADKILFDRSIFSVILFQKYIRTLNLDDHASAYEYAKERAKVLIEGNLVSMPDALIFLSADFETIQMRHEREISVGLLRSKSAHSFFDEHYQAIARIYQPDDLSLVLESVNSPESLRLNTQEVCYKLEDWYVRQGSAEPQELAIQVVETI